MYMYLHIRQSYNKEFLLMSEGFVYVSKFFVITNSTSKLYSIM